MGIFDSAKDASGAREEQVEAGIDKAGDAVDEKTGDTYAGQVDQAQDYLKDQVGEPNT